MEIFAILNMLKEVEVVLKQRGFTDVLHQGERSHYMQPGAPKLLNELNFVKGTTEKSLEILDNPNVLRTLFKENGFEVVSPISVINHGGSTLFTSAGVQILEGVFHHQHPLPPRSQFVAQPVFRTQYMESPGEGFCSSFVNIATVSAGKPVEEHVENLVFWLDFLTTCDLKPIAMKFTTEQQLEKWGDKKLSIEILRISYLGLPIGDANFIASFPQEGRPTFAISDIGFGLERLRWVMIGGKFWESIYRSTTDINDPIILDSVNTLSLLAASGLEPSNKEEGYRFRRLSKRLVAAARGKALKLSDLISKQYDKWLSWINPVITRDKAINMIMAENNRNLNASLLAELKKMGYVDVGIDINLPLAKVLALLHGTSARSAVPEALKKLDIVLSSDI